MKFERRSYRWRMNDPGLALSERKRPAHVSLAVVVFTKHRRAQSRGYARGPNGHGRRFWTLSTEVLDAWRIGIDPRLLRGAGTDFHWKRKR